MYRTEPYPSAEKMSPQLAPSSMQVRSRFQQVQDTVTQGLGERPVGKHGAFLAGRSFSILHGEYAWQATVLSAFCINTSFSVESAGEVWFKKRARIGSSPVSKLENSKNSNYIGRSASQRESIWWWSSGLPSGSWRSLKSCDWSALFSKLHGASHAPRGQPPWYVTRSYSGHLSPLHRHIVLNTPW